MKKQDINVGDSILLIKSNNGALQHEGKILKVLKVLGGTIGTDKCTVYMTGYSDEFIKYTRVGYAEYLESKVSNMEKEIKLMKVKIKSLRTYKDDEEEMAHKIKELLANKNDVEALAELLRVKDRTDFL